MIIITVFYRFINVHVFYPSLSSSLGFSSGKSANSSSADRSTSKSSASIRPFNRLYPSLILVRSLFKVTLRALPCRLTVSRCLLNCDPPLGSMASRSLASYVNMSSCRSFAIFLVAWEILLSYDLAVKWNRKGSC